jgi:hypothetical protein
MGAWFVRPETRRLPLSDGEWIVVKQRLSAGEFRAHLTRSTYLDADGRRRLDPLLHGISKVIAYLVDWSLPDAVIRGASAADLTAALDSLKTERYAEIQRAIDAHEDAMAAEREQEKNVTDGGSTSSAISPSPFAVAGASSGSAT